MTLHRNTFFVVVFLLIAGPFLFYKAWWIVRATKTTGTYYFTGHGNLGSALGISTYPVIRIAFNKDSVEFKGNVMIEDLQPGMPVPVLYPPGHPDDAVIDRFISLWGETLIYLTFPLLVILIVYLRKDIVPHRTRLQIGGRPWLRFTGGVMAPGAA